MGMMESLDKLPWGTILGGIIVLLVTVLGGGLVLFTNELVWKDYIQSLSDVAVGVGLVAVGRGVTKAGKHVAQDDANR
jgi:predicted permease